MAPCEEAKQETLTYIDWRTCKTLDEARNHRALGERRFCPSANHREENGMVARDLPGRTAWTTELDSLDDLLALERKYGDLIIEQSNFREVPVEIQIDDDYR